MIEYLKWDSEFFGYKIGKVKLEKIGDFSIDRVAAKQQNYQLVYLIIEQELYTKRLQEELSKNDVKLVDEKVTFFQNIPFKADTNSLFDNIEVYVTKEADPKLIDLSLQSGIYSRFKTDENFVRNEYEKLYTAWMENSINGQIANKVIVAYQESEIIGVLTLAFKDRFSDIGILAVDSNYRGQKIGQKLVSRAIYETSILAINKIQVVTQKENKRACNFYENQHFKVQKLEYIYHMWL